MARRRPAQHEREERVAHGEGEQQPPVSRTGNRRPASQLAPARTAIAPASAAIIALIAEFRLPRGPRRPGAARATSRSAPRPAAAGRSSTPSRSRPARAASPPSSSRPQTSSTDWYAGGRLLQPRLQPDARAASAAARARMSTCSRVGQLARRAAAPRARCPTVKSTAPAAISGPRWAGGLSSSSRSSRRGMRPDGIGAMAVERRLRWAAGAIAARSYASAGASARRPRRAPGPARPAAGRPPAPASRRRRRAGRPSRAAGR